MIKILHIFPDDKFFDGVSDFFDSLDNTENIYIFYSEIKYNFQFIKKVTKIKRFYNYSDFTNYIKTAEVDIIYLHSLRNISLFRYFRSDVKVIWWSWGFDLYSNPSPLSKPLIDLDLYKPLTQSLLDASKDQSILRWLKDQVIKLIIDNRLKKAVARVDYFTPVLTNEYYLMSSNKYFRAKPFRIENGPGSENLENLYYQDKLGNILIGNSFTPSNNHLDIFKLIKNYRINDRKLIIPVNYGTGYPISLNELKLLSNIDVETALWLEKFLPFDEYKSINKTISHAIFGHIRQQAVGNHRMCIAHGVKMFFYKDSVNYAYYKGKGFNVYSIEDDLNNDELSRNLTYEEASHNYELLFSILSENKSKYEEELKKIIDIR